MVLSEEYKRRLSELSGINPDNIQTLEEASVMQDPYAASKSRVKFDMELMKQAIEGGIEIGLVFQSNNEKYKMPIWKTRIVWPFAMGVDKKGNLVIRGVHVDGQSEKKALEKTPRQGSAQAKDEWRLFKVSNIKSMFFTGGYFQGPPAGIQGAFNPNDSAMSKMIAVFDKKKAINYQKNLQKNVPVSNTPVDTQKAGQKQTKAAVKPQTIPKQPTVKPQTNQDLKDKANARKLKDKVDTIDSIVKKLKESFQNASLKRLES
jgi:hypothetical protein